MKIRSMIAGLVLALGTLGMATLAQAAKFVEVEIGIAPPPERVEVVPAPRAGYVYERGHFAWDGQRYVWVEAQFIREREGHVYTPYVLERRGEKFYFRGGHWDDD